MLNILQAKSSPQTFSLRVSVLENCQYRCSYCLPGAVKPFANKPSWLKPHEYEVIARSLSHLPINKMRFTGGEPLLRKDLCDIVAAFKNSFPNAEFAITTNGEHLGEKMEALNAAGISRVTVHIDSLDEENYKRTMGASNFNSVLDALPKASRTFEEVKINTVLQKGINDHELVDFIHFSMKENVQVRFIEMMNTGSARDFVNAHFLSGADAIAIISQSLPVRSIPRRHASDPAALYQIEGTQTVFGLIASDTQPFCSDCDRLRLNAEGLLRGCLYEPSGVNLARLLRNDISFEDMKNTIDMSVQAKRSFHPLVGATEYSFSMAEIGG